MITAPPITSSLVQLKQPQSVEETGLAFSFLADLALKIVYFAGEMTGFAIAEAMCLPFVGIVEEILAFLSKEEFVSVTGSNGFGERAFKYVVTIKGNNKVRELLNRNQYAGPAPVQLSTYTVVAHAQQIRDVRVNWAQIREAFSHLVLSDAMLRRIGPAVNSARSIFFYGPPGNGKTTIAEGIAQLLGGQVYIPYAVEVDGQVIKVFDGLNHEMIEPSQSTESIRRDQRWVLCKRPFIVAGGELSLESLDLVFDPVSKVYEAPFQMKANSGMFLIDDFGRQQVPPRDLLNRWIVPLEKRNDFLRLQTGKKIEVPFDVLIVFSTNINPAELVDDAFLRRIRHKVMVPNPTWDEYREIFIRVARSRDLPYSDEGLAYLVQEHYLKAKREPKSVQPRDLIDQIEDVARFLDIAPAMSHELIDQAVEAYFVKL